MASETPIACPSPLFSTGNRQPVNDELDGRFKELNRTADEQVAAEKQRIIRKFIQARKENVYVDSFSPQMVMERDNRPTPGTAAGITANIIPQPPSTAKSATQHAIWGVIVGASTQFCLGVGEVVAAPPEQRMAAFLRLAKDVCIAAGTSGVVVYMAKKLEEFLKANATKILAVLCDPKRAEELAFKVAGKATSTSAACGALASGAFLAIQSLWYAVKSGWAKACGDTETSNIEWEKAKKALGLDNLVRTFVSAVSGVVISAFVIPAAGTGFLGFLLPCFVYFLAQWLTEYIISKKNHYGGWGVWLASYFMEYRGAKVWKGGLFEAFEARITSELHCTISGEIVVNPVRSIRTGRIYERANIYKWIDDKRTDPLTREQTTRLDFIDCPVARQYAADIAALLEAMAVPEP